jgi:PHP family Zn ribbon phosphoesterase
MKFTVDLHIHTVLSPCGDLEMSPVAIIERALEKKLDLIGITDHNSTRQSKLIREIGEQRGISVLTGVEVSTREEVHCLAFFEYTEELDAFQQFLDDHLPDIKNNVNYFGYQVVVNERNEIIYTEEKLLLSALSATIDEVQLKVRKLNGIFIPAHIDRLRFGLFGQLGFLPSDLSVDALEISANCTPEVLMISHPEIKNHALVRGSDAHRLTDVGKSMIRVEMKSIEFKSLKELFTLNQENTIEIIN